MEDNKQVAVVNAEMVSDRQMVTSTPEKIRANVNLIQQVMQGVMHKGTHFDTVPGCGPKPTLLKPGAEKLCATFLLAPDPIIEDLSNSDERRYRIKCRLIHSPSGTFVGSGVGEASSNEEKFKWRKAVCQEEFNDTPEDRRRKKYFSNGSTALQVRTNIADIANTVLKMAKKRAMVDGVLTVTGASDMFTQDIEDMEIEQKPVMAHKPAPTPKPTPTMAPKPTEKPPQAAEDAVIVDTPTNTSNKPSNAVSGHLTAYYPPKGKGPCSFKVNDNNDYFKTFDKDMMAMLENAHKTGETVSFQYEVIEKNGFTNNMVKNLEIKAEESYVPTPMGDEEETPGF